MTTRTLDVDVGEPRGLSARHTRQLLLCPLLVLIGLSAACSKHKDESKSERRTPSALKPSPTEKPELLYLPDGGDIAPPPPAERPALQPTAAASTLNCPPEMVDVAGHFCIDRYEASLVDATSGRHYSPYYSPAPAFARRSRDQWADTGLVDPALDIELPPLPEWQLGSNLKPMAASVAGVVPNGYLTGVLAEEICENADKRLCKPDEWVLACRGQQGRKFPYGDSYEQGRCNVFRPAHPAVLLHGNASTGHQDPRLNLAKYKGDRLLRPTGATKDCRSEWGEDAIYDMVGNLDEWVDEDTGAFQGGFFSRATKEGCDSRITVHPREYFDYSLGVRCCK